MANALLEPGFAKDPPVKLNVNAKILGLVIAILAVIGAIFTLFVGGLFSIFALVGGGLTVIWLLGIIVGLGAEILGAVGGFQMYNDNRDGKRLVIYGLALGIAGALVVLIGQFIAYAGLLGYGAGGAIVGLILDIIIYGIIWYLVVISRFPGEAPLVATPGGFGSPPPPPPPTA